MRNHFNAEIFLPKLNLPVSSLAENEKYPLLTPLMDWSIGSEIRLAPDLK